MEKMPEDKAYIAEHSQKTEEKLADPEEFILNPEGLDPADFWIRNEGGYLVTPKFEIGLGNIRKIGDIKEFGEKFKKEDNKYYRLHLNTAVKRLIENTNTDFLNKDVAINLVRWLEEKDCETAGVISHLKNLEKIDDSVVSELLADRKNNAGRDGTILGLVENSLLTEDQIKEIILTTGDSYLKGELIKRCEEFSSEEMVRLFRTTRIDRPSDVESFSYFLDDLLTSKRFFQTNEERKRFADVIFDDLIDLVNTVNKNQGKETKLREELHNILEKHGFKEDKFDYVLKKDEWNATLFSFLSGQEKAEIDPRINVIQEDLESYKFIKEKTAEILWRLARYDCYNEEQLLTLVDKYPINSQLDSTISMMREMKIDPVPLLPGWAYYGLVLRGDNNKKFKNYAAMGSRKTEEKEKYALMDKLYSSESPISEILTPQEQAEIIEDIKEYGLKIFDPIITVDEDNAKALEFVHRSSYPNLKCLLPQRPSGTDRGMRAVFLQKRKPFIFSNDDFLGWQREVLDGEDKIYSYIIKIKEEDLKKFYEDSRWEGGVWTEQPILLNPDVSFNWDMFTDEMKTRVLYKYEKIFGEVHGEIRKRLWQNES